MNEIQALPMPSGRGQDPSFWEENLITIYSSIGSGFGGASSSIGSGFGGASSSIRSGFGGASSSIGSGFGGASSSIASGVSLRAGAQNEKETMQDLNDRLAFYLERVRSLESSNQKLEMQIRQQMEKKRPARDWSPYFKTIEELQKQICADTVANTQLVMQTDNARLAADDFRVKYELELAIRQSVEADVNGLRKVIDDKNVSRYNLEHEIESLKEELAFLKRTHQDDVNQLQAQIASSAVTVEIDAPKSQDLGKIMAEIRAQYDDLAQKNRKDAEMWYQSKVEVHTMQVTQDTAALDSAKATVVEIRRNLQALEIELDTLRNQKLNLENSLQDTKHRYAMELEMLGGNAQALEGELTQVRTDCQRQQQEYQALLNAKLRLEAEIQTYRRLLDADDLDLQDAVSASPTSTTQTVKVITTTQDTVNGKVVSESNDTPVLKS